MKYFYSIIITLLIVIMGSCDKEEANREMNYVFLKKYCATVTVGGVVGIAERCFEIGDVFVGEKKTEEIITIRIAAHIYLNDGPPSNVSYQEFLDVPSDYLEILKR